MTPALFKAFHHRGRIVERTASELQRLGWKHADVRDAIAGGHLKKQKRHDCWIYGLVSEPDWTQQPQKPQPVKVNTMPRTEAEYAKAWKALCRAEGHIARLPEKYHKGAA